jgi:UDPglucose 6-dehydrogenase
MKIGVLGLGRLGSVAAAGFAFGGHDVVGVDIDAERVDSYRQGSVPIYEPGLPELINQGMANGKLSFINTSEVSAPIGDIIVITTGTPAAANGSTDLSQVHSAIAWAKKHQPNGGVVVMKSTVPPGTGGRLADTVLKHSGFEYISNPEFLGEGQAVHDWFHPDRIVIGQDHDGLKNFVEDLYQGIEAPVVVTDVTSAEMIKYAANAFLATKISFVNEIAVLCDLVGASIDDVTQGISLDPRVGSSFLRAGVGYGGSCFPKDVRSLDYLALTNGQNFELLRSVIAVNNRQRLLPFHALNEQFTNLSGVKVGILGLAFKPNTDDLREAPSVDLIKLLVEAEAAITAYDPEAVPAAKAVLPDAVNLTEDMMTCVQGAEALVLITEWPEIVDADWAKVAERMSEPRFIFDGRNALDPARMKDLGFQYLAVGRGTNYSNPTSAQHITGDGES